MKKVVLGLLGDPAGGVGAELAEPVAMRLVVINDRSDLKGEMLISFFRTSLTVGSPCKVSVAEVAHDQS